MMDYDVHKMFEWPLPARVFILAFISLMIIFLGYFFDVSSFQADIQSSLAQEDDLKQQLTLLINKESTIKNDITQLPKLKNTLAQWQEKFVTTSGFPVLLDQILKYGEDNHLKINTVDPGNEVKEGMYYKSPVKINMTGTYDDIANFISQIANMPQMVIIDKYTLNNEITGAAENSKPLNSDDVLSAELEIDIYRK